MRTMTTKTIPNPGSDEALDRGCRCAVLDNNHGKYAPWPPDDWWISESCPLYWGTEWQ
jgi:hypothetical protein